MERDDSKDGDGDGDGDGQRRQRLSINLLYYAIFNVRVCSFLQKLHPHASACLYQYTTNKLYVNVGRQVFFILLLFLFLLIFSF